MKVATNVSTSPIQSSLTDLQFDLTNTCAQLLTIFLMAAVKGPAKEKYVNNIMSQLDASAQFQIMSLIQQVDYRISTDFPVS
jgi:hypothetical protein